MLIILIILKILMLIILIMNLCWKFLINDNFW